MLYAILKPIAVALMRTLFRLEARGMEHIPGARPGVAGREPLELPRPAAGGRHVAAAPCPSWRRPSCSACRFSAD